MIRPAAALPAFHRLEDLIEGDDDVIEFAEIKLQRQVCARHPARDRDRPVSEPGADFFVRRIGARTFASGGDHHGAVAIAHAGAAGQKGIPVAHIGKGVNRDRGNVQLAAKRSLVQRLNIFEPMLEAITAQVDLVFRHRVKHEGVIRVGRMAQGENFRFGRHGAC